MPIRFSTLALIVVFYLCGVFTAKIFHNPLFLSTENLSTEKAMNNGSVLQGNEPSRAYTSFADFISEANSHLAAIIEEDE